MDACNNQVESFLSAPAAWWKASTTPSARSTFTSMRCTPLGWRTTAASTTAESDLSAGGLMNAIFDGLRNARAHATLGERRAELSDDIAQLESRLRSLRTSLEHLDTALASLDPDRDPKVIPNKRTRRVKLFGQGKFNCMVMDATREGGRPMTTLEITEAICDRLSYGEAAKASMRNRVRANLLYLWKVRGVICKAGERETARWELTASHPRASFGLDA
jgi:hypothetical protein